MSALARALLADLTPAELAELAERLRPFLDSGPASERLLTPAQAAAQLGIHPKTLTRATAAGRVHGAVRVGRSWRYPASELRLDPPAAITVTAAKPPRPRARSAAASAADAIRGRR